MIAYNRMRGYVRDLIPVDVIQQRIFEIGGEKVMLDRHLAQLYGVQTRVLNQAVRRNIERFPQEFMFQLTKEQRDEVITICDDLKPLKYARTMPYAFTEYGVAMLSSVLNSKQAIQVNIQIIKAFVKLRKMLSSHTELRRKLEEMEKKYDKQFKIVFSAIKQLMAPPEKPKRRIGFH